MQGLSKFKWPKLGCPGRRTRQKVPFHWIDQTNFFLTARRQPKAITPRIANSIVDRQTVDHFAMSTSLVAVVIA